MAIDDAISASGSQVPPEITSLLEPLVEIIGPIVGTVSWLLGGVFGVYLLLLIVRAYYDQKKVRIMKEMRDDLKFIRQQAAIQSAEQNYLVIDKKIPKKKNNKSKNSKK